MGVYSSLCDTCNVADDKKWTVTQAEIDANTGTSEASVYLENADENSHIEEFGSLIYDEVNFYFKTYDRQTVV